MKLYTKEMFLIASEKCEVSMIDAEHIMKYIDEYVTPISLPSDEEIEEKSECFLKDLQIASSSINRSIKLGIEEGAKWVIDKIKNQQL